MEIIVYADILFFWNYLMDFQIIFLTTVFSRNSYNLGRMTLATGILALYGTLSFLPEYKLFYSLIGKFVVSGIAVFLIIFPCGWQRFWKGMGIFYLLSAGFGGVVFALAMGTDLGQNLQAVAVNGQVYLALDFWVLLSGIVVSYLLFWGFQKISIRNFSRDRILVKLSFVAEKKEFVVTTLLDTGCEVTAPITGEGVILVAPSVLKDMPIKTDFILPIHTAGGICHLKAFYPEEVSCRDQRYQMAEHPLIAVGQGEFSSDGLYQSICNPKILQERENVGGRMVYEKLVRKGKTGLAKTVDKNKTFPEEGSLLHRRKRSPAGTTWQGRRGTVFTGVEPSANLSESPPDPYREKSSVGGIHSQKV